MAGENCTFMGECKCFVTIEGVVADCSKLNLTSSRLPVFHNGVIAIDLSHNKLTDFPTVLPVNLVHLNLSFNNLEGNVVNTYTLTFGTALKSLKLDNNNLSYVSNLKNVFDKFENLTLLSMKYKFTPRNTSFFVGLLENLVHLTQLDYNGYNHGTVSSLFDGHNNSLQRLDLSGSDGTCYMEHIGKDMFQNLTDLKSISVSYCGVKSVDLGVFEHLFMLQHLDISNNKQLTLDVLANLTFSDPSSIQQLVVNQVHCTFGLTTEIREEHVKPWSETNLTELSVASNRIALLQVQVLKMLPKSLQVINIADNQLMYGLYVFHLANLENLKTLNISYQINSHSPTITDFLEQCKDRREKMKLPLRSSEIQSILQHGYYDTNFTMYIPPRLTTIFVSQTRYTLSVQNLFILANNAVTKLIANKNLFFEIRAPMMGLQRLEHVDLSENMGSFIAGDSFIDCKNLKVLNLSYNFLGSCMENDTNGNVFNHLYNLEVFDLSYNRILSLSNQAFKSFYNIKNLTLSFNKLCEWNVDVEHMKNLELLDLSYNEIPIFNEKMIRALESLRPLGVTKINLYKNPLHCSCESLEFLKWMNRSTRVHFIHMENYTCHFANGTKGAIGDIQSLVVRMERQCAKYSTLITMCVLGMFVFFIVVVKGLLYRYKWRIKYMYYNAKSRYKARRCEKKEHPVKYRFDAFISFAEEDQHLFIDEILRIERSEHVRYCIHSRDFIPGTNIADNIVNTIRNSRRTVCMLSINYVRSLWCMFEFNMARMEGIYSASRHGENVTLLVVLNENVIAHRDLSPSMISLMESQSYLKFPTDKKELRAFWEKFSIYLQDFTETL